MNRPLLFPAFSNGQSINVLSGTPTFMLEGAAQCGLEMKAVNVPMSQEMPVARALWQLGRLAKRKPLGGFTMSPALLAAIWDRADAFPAGSEILSTFALMSPRFLDRAERGEVTLNYYVDSSYREYVSTYGEHKKADPEILRFAFALEERGFRLARNVFTFCEASADYIMNQYRIRAKVVLPGPNITESAVEQANSVQRSTQGAPFVITFVGMDWERKGLPLIADAVAKLREGGHDVVLRVIGSASPEIAAMAGVEFIGRIDKSTEMLRYAQLVRDSDLGILMSDAEAFGLSPLESLAMGVPVVSTAIGGMLDYVTPDLGILVDVGAGMPALVDALLPLVSRGPRWQALKHVAEQRKTSFSWASTMRNIGRELGHAIPDLQRSPIAAGAATPVH